MSKEQKVEVATRQRPYVQEAIQTQILYDIAGMLEDQGKTLIDFFNDWKETIPRGRIRPLDLTVTATITELNPTNAPDMPWMTIDLFNDGPNPVYVTINEEFTRRKAPLTIGETLTVDMKKRNINKIFLFCDAGNTANIRIYAKS